MPKWHYTIRYVEFARLFEMPLQGYVSCLPFGLEAFSASASWQACKSGCPRLTC